MIFEKVTLKVDINKTEEKDFITSFYKEYAASPSNIEQSFMARMQEDIMKRRWKDDQLK